MTRFRFANWLLVLVGGLSATSWAATTADPAAPSGVCETCGTVSGAVTAAADGEGIANYTVVATSHDDGSYYYAQTIVDGSYSFGQTLPAGDYLVYTNGDGYVNQRNDRQPCTFYCGPLGATLLTVADGGTTTVDFALEVGALLQGTVLGPGGTPVNNAIVAVVSDVAGQFQVSTAPDGTFATPRDLPAGEYRLRTFNAVGLVDEAHPDIPCMANQCPFEIGDIVVLATGDTGTIDFNLAAGGRIGGRVTAASNGAPLADATIVIQGAAGSIAVGTAADGTYLLQTGLPPGDWFAIALPMAGYLGETWNDVACIYCSPLRGNPISIVGSETVGDIDFGLELAGRLIGTVTDVQSGAPIGDAWVTAYDAEGIPVAVTSADPSGDYMLEGLAQGAYHLGAERSPDYGLGYVGCEQPCEPFEGTAFQVTGGNDTVADVTLTRGSVITGRITGIGGVPIANVDVFASHRTNRRTFSGTSDGNGDYRIEGMLPGPYDVLVFPPELGDYVTTYWPRNVCMTADCDLGDPVLLGIGEERSDIDISLIVGGRIGGRVTASATGAGIPDAEVRFDVGGDTVFSGAYTDANGDYLSPALPPYAYYALTRTFGPFIDEAYDDLPCTYGCDEALATALVVTPGVVLDADFALDAGGRIAGRIVDEQGDPLPGPNAPWVNVFRPDGTVAVQASVDDDGNYVTAGLPDGDYYVRSRNRSGYINELFDDIRCFSCDLLLGAPVPVIVGQITNGVDFELAPGARLGGDVFAARDGSPAPSTDVMVFDADGEFEMTIGSNSDGSWRSAGGFAPGTYYLQAPPTYQLHGQLYDLLPCDTVAACDPTTGTPVIVTDTTERNDIDFWLEDAVLFGSGFETPATAP